MIFRRSKKIERSPEGKSEEGTVNKMRKVIRGMGEEWKREIKM